MSEESKPKQPEPNNRLPFFLLSGLVLVFLFFTLDVFKSQPVEISYSEFLQELGMGKIKDVNIVNMREITGVRYDESNRATGFRAIIPYFDESLLGRLEKGNVSVSGSIENFSLGSLILQFLPMVILAGFFIWLYRSMNSGNRNAFSFGRSRARKYEQSGEVIKFKDVAGQREAKYELSEIVDFLQAPERFTRLGARIPKGVLLVGSPGTGKTLLAKAVAGEADVPFFHMSGSDFVEMFVGVGASRVRDLFEKGRKNAPCILFIDEIDAVGRTRGSGYGGGHDEREQTLNQLLVEMDGFDTYKGVIIVAATNRVDVLDPALLRPGRFDRQVVVAMPDVKERQSILEIHAAKITLEENVDLSVMARATPGSSGADIANIVNEAALFAGRENRECVTMGDFENARDKILMGVARHSMAMSPEEKRMTACHEAGHALLHYYIRKANPVHKVTIVPHGQALGVTFSLPENDQHSHSVTALKAQLVIFYGGYAAEEIVYNETTTGAQSDISRATELARRMVCDWGMSEIGPIALGNDDQPVFIAREISQRSEYSEHTVQNIDREIERFLLEALETARKILREQKDKLDILTKELLERETLDDREIRKLLKIEDSVDQRQKNSD